MTKTNETYLIKPVDLKSHAQIERPTQDAQNAIREAMRRAAEARARGTVRQYEGKQQPQRNVR